MIGHLLRTHTVARQFAGIFIWNYTTHTHTLTHTHTHPRALKDTCQTDSVIAMVTQYVGMAAKFLIHNCACLNTSLFIPEKEKKNTHMEYSETIQSQ